MNKQRLKKDRDYYAQLAEKWREISLGLIGIDELNERRRVDIAAMELTSWVSVDDALPKLTDGAVNVRGFDEDLNEFVGKGYYKIFGTKEMWLDEMMMPFSNKGITITHWWSYAVSGA